MIIHVVKPGETVVSIAAQYGVLPDLLSLANGVGGQSLVPGQTLVVRYPAGILTVQPGDTLYSIALREGVSVLQLWRCNPWLWGTERLYPGQTLVTGYQQEQQSTLLVTGYAYPYIREDLLRQTLPYLSACIPFTHGFTPEGRLLPLGDGALLALARQYGAESWMHLSTLTDEGGFSSALAEALLQNDAARARLAGEIAAQMAEKGYAGLDVDFEYLDCMEYQGKEYLVLMPADEAETQIVILEVEPVDDENENYLAVEDEAVLDAVYGMFKEKYKDVLTFED